MTVTKTGRVGKYGVDKQWRRRHTYIRVVYTLKFGLEGRVTSLPLISNWTRELLPIDNHGL